MDALEIIRLWMGGRTDIDGQNYLADLQHFVHNWRNYLTASIHRVGNLTATQRYKKVRDVIKKQALCHLAFNQWGRVEQWMFDVNTLIYRHNTLTTNSLTPAIVNNAHNLHNQIQQNIAMITHSALKQIKI